MLLKKLLLLAIVALIALFMADTEARKHKRHGRRHKQRSKGWRKFVHRKCKTEGDAVVVIGGEINKTMIRAVTRAHRKGYKFQNLAINGRDLVQPHDRKDRKRNIKFIKKVAEYVNIIVLPWSTKHDPHKMKTKHALKLYQKSAKAFEKVLKTKPVTIHVPPKSLNKKLVKYLTKKGFIVIGKTISTPSNKNLDKHSFIGIQEADTKAYARFLRRTKKADYTLVPLADCIGKSTFKGGIDGAI